MSCCGAGGWRGRTGQTDEEAGGLEVSGFEVTQEVLKEYSPAARPALYQQRFMVCVVQWKKQI